MGEVEDEADKPSETTGVPRPGDVGAGAGCVNIDNLGSKHGALQVAGFKGVGVGGGAWMRNSSGEMRDGGKI